MIFVFCSVCTKQDILEPQNENLILKYPKSFVQDNQIEKLKEEEKISAECVHISVFQNEGRQKLLNEILR